MDKIRFQIIAAIAVSAAVAIVIYPPPFFVFELAHSIMPHIMIGLWMLAIAALFRNKFLLAFVTFFGGLGIFSHFSEAILPRPAANSASADLTIAQFNVLFVNENYSGVIDQAKSTNADFISFQEVDQEWARKLNKELSVSYPFYLDVPRKGSKGISVYSRYPLDRLRVEDIQNSPSIIGDILTPKGKVFFVATHAKAPITQSNFVDRNLQLEQVSRMVQKVDYAAVTVGDYNLIPWSKYYKAFVTDSGFANSRSDYASTWPAGLGIFKIPIDHIFYNKKLTCVGFKTVKTSSDHFGIIGRYNLQSTNNEEEIK